MGSIFSEYSAPRRKEDANMIVIMRRDASKADVSAAIEMVEEAGFRTHVSEGVERVVFGIIGEGSKEDLGERLMQIEGVERAIPVLAPYKLAAREAGVEPTVVRIGDVPVGGGHFAVMAGPCAVENAETLLETARRVRDLGARVLRGGAFKPRSSPYSFQGLGVEGLALLAEARAETGLPVVTEIMDTRDVEVVARYADAFQVGMRNMQNFSLLKEIGQTRLPVILKRNHAATYEEWLMAAEYILAAGNPHVILCERGIRTFETHTRNTMDIAAIPAAHELSHLPVVADPSHGTGRWRMVIPMTLAAVAAGADGILVEVHVNPKEAVSDGAQTLNVPHFEELMEAIGQVRRSVMKATT